MAAPTSLGDLRSASAADLDRLGAGRLPGLIGMEFVEVSPQRMRSRLAVRPELLAPHDFLHAATVVALADTTCGFGTLLNLPEGAHSFTTLELKSNFTGTVREGVIECEAAPLHRGRNTQLWDARVFDRQGDRTIALFRCTQMILWPRAPVTPPPP